MVRKKNHNTPLQYKHHSQFYKWLYLPVVMGGQLSVPASDMGYDILAARPLLSAEFIDIYAASEGWGA